MNPHLRHHIRPILNKISSTSLPRKGFRSIQADSRDMIESKGGHVRISRGEIAELFSFYADSNWPPHVSEEISITGDLDGAFAQFCTELEQNIVEYVHDPKNAENINWRALGFTRYPLQERFITNWVEKEIEPDFFRDFDVRGRDPSDLWDEMMKAKPLIDVVPEREAIRAVSPDLLISLNDILYEEQVAFETYTALAGIGDFGDFFDTVFINPRPVIQKVGSGPFQKVHTALMNSASLGFDEAFDRAAEDLEEYYYGKKLREIGDVIWEQTNELKRSRDSFPEKEELIKKFEEVFSLYENTEFSLNYHKGLARLARKIGNFAVDIGDSLKREGHPDHDPVLQVSYSLEEMVYHLDELVGRLEKGDVFIDRW